jgi:hypothetical protein
MEVVLDRVELAGMASGDDTQEAAHRGRRRWRHAQDVGAQTVGAQGVDVAHPLAAGQQRVDRRHRLPVGVGGARRLAQVDVLLEQFGEAQVLASVAGRMRPALATMPLALKVTSRGSRACWDGATTRCSLTALWMRV